MTGCLTVLAALLAAIALWWLIASHVGTGDDGPRGALVVTADA